jgi:hypothetical protein
MDHKLASEEIIRQYLLGTLHEPELSEVEEALFLNKDREMSQTASLIEDELIDQYLDGTLDLRERHAVQNHFLRPPERRQKLHFARLLRYQLETHVPPARFSLNRFLRTYAASVAAAVFASLSLYLGIALHEATIANQALGAKLQTNAGAQDVHLPLVYGVTRGAGPLPTVTIGPTTRTIKVELALPSAFADLFDASLLDRGQTEALKIWSKTGVQASSSHLELAFDMPSQGIRSGTYDLVVSSSRADSTPIRYPFNARVIP